MKYAYLGEIPIDQFNSLSKAFPAIVGLGTTQNDDGDYYIVCGCSKELEDRAIGMYQLIVFMWTVDDDTKSAVWDCIC